MPLPLNFETRKKVYADIIVNEGKVMFASEFKKYNETFLKRLQSAMQSQYYSFINLGRAMSAPAVSYSNSSISQNKKSNNYRRYNYHKRKH